ncbi:MAG: ABC transporter permease, partial [Bacteroidales bacterium]|nr:ABC transporter permease [Bacteroidales bacterium]
MSVNKLRTFLSLFGITIGIVSIISVFTVFDWMEKSIRTSIETLGDNTVYVQKMPWTPGPDMKWWDIIRWPATSPEDYEAVLKKSSTARAVCYSVFTPRTVKFRSNSVSDVRITAVTHDFEQVRSFEIEKGRYFSQNESVSGKPVAIIGGEVARRLFSDLDPVGKEINISGFKTLVIGIFKKEGKGGLSDSGMDELMLIPLNFGRHFINFRNRYLNSDIMIRGREGVSVQELSDEVTMILRAARRLRPGEVSNFSINQASQITKTLEPIFAGINIAGWI